MTDGKNININKPYSDTTDNICINENNEQNKSSNESMDHSSNDTTIAQSILDKLDDTQLMKKYVTPKQLKKSSSYVESPLSGKHKYKNI